MDNTRNYNVSGLDLYVCCMFTNGKGAITGRTWSKQSLYQTKFYLCDKYNVQYRKTIHMFQFVFCVVAQCLFYICVCFTAITEPSMSGALLLLLLLVCGIYWAKFDPISITAVLCYVMVITTCSLLCLNAYQFDYVQDKIGGDGALVSR